MKKDSIFNYNGNKLPIDKSSGSPKLHILRSPTPKSAKNLLENALREKKTTIVVGSCIVNYQGRAGSVLPEGERVVMIKPDGTLLVHQKKKREPVNWNPPGCNAEVKLEEEGLQLISKRSQPRETLIVLFKEFKIAASFSLEDKEELKLVGTEEDLVNSVLRDPTLVEKGFEPREREKSIESGMIDLYGVDSSGKETALEFKRGKATLSAVGQLSRYVKELEKKKKKEIRGILAAPKITSGARKLLNKEGLEYLKIEETPTQKFEKVIYDKNQKQIKEFAKDSGNESGN